MFVVVQHILWASAAALEQSGVRPYCNIADTQSHFQRAALKIGA
jgi:hypothetical protein